MDSIDAAGAGIGEDGYENVLLHVEGSRIKGEFITGILEEGPRRERRSHEAAEGHDGDLGRDGGNRERLLAVPEELVEEGQDDAAEGAQNPHPEGQHRYVWVVRNRHRQRYLLYGRILLFHLPMSY